MAEVSALASYCDGLLDAASFADSCPNGLQVEGERPVRRLVTGVTASLALIEAAVDEGADAILVHHGWFWKGESPCLTGIKGRRARALMGAGVSMLAYHLPLDAHPELGNNACLGRVLGLVDAQPTRAGEGLVWWGRLPQPMPAAAFAEHLGRVLGRPALHVAGQDRPLARLAWCTGAAQGLLSQAAALGVEAYLSGEISERTTHEARELGVDYFAGGHHATERYGVMALGEHLAERFGLAHRFFDLANPA